MSQVKWIIVAGGLAVGAAAFWPASAPALAGGYPGHQCTDVEGDDLPYCSCDKVKNHDEGSLWIKNLVEALNVKPTGKPWIEDSLPVKSHWWPKPCKG